jgi:hypothetical protein
MTLWTVEQGDTLHADEWLAAAGESLLASGRAAPSRFVAQNQPESGRCSPTSTTCRCPT